MITHSKTNSIGLQVQLVFEITQHVRDERLLKSFIGFFNSGYLVKYREAIDFKVTKFEDIHRNIIPFFQKYKIRGIKALDFAD